MVEMILLRSSLQHVAMDFAEVARKPQNALWVLACAASIIHLQPVQATLALVGLLCMGRV